MANRELISNCLEWGLLVGSVAVWGWVIYRWVHRQPILEQVESRPFPWTPGQFLLGFMLVYLAPAMAVLLILVVLGPIEKDTLAYIQANSLAFLSQIAMVIGLAKLAGTVDAEDLGFRFQNWRTDLGIGVGGCLASFAPIVLITNTQHYLGWRDVEDKNQMLEMLLKSSEPSLIFWIIFSAALLAPITEELVYRVLLQGWAQTRVSARQAIALSTMIFVVLHPRFDWLPLTSLAMILGYVYYRRRSFLAVATIHALFNGAMLTFALLLKK